MSDVTTILNRINRGDAAAMNELLPLVYDELRNVAGNRLADERAGHTLQATALVHEVYLRLFGADARPTWTDRGHFFAAAAEAMRRVLIDYARKRRSKKRGGGWQPVNLEQAVAIDQTRLDRLLVLDDAIRQFERCAPDQAQVVKLRFYVGLTIEETANSLGISVSTANRHWTYAKAWLACKLKE